MHPGDVAEFVAESVEDLHAALHARPELGVKSVELRGGTRLLVRFETATSEAAPVFGGLSAVPIIGTRRTEDFILAMDCDDWDSQPPTAELLRADETPLPPDRWPHDPRGQGIVQGHPIFGDRKFFCRVGTREFHTHPQHEDEPWDRYREGFSLTGIVIGLLSDLTRRWTMR